MNVKCKKLQVASILYLYTLPNNQPLIVYALERKASLPFQTYSVLPIVYKHQLLKCSNLRLPNAEEHNPLQQQSVTVIR